MISTMLGRLARRDEEVRAWRGWASGAACRLEASSDRRRTITTTVMSVSMVSKREGQGELVPTISQPVNRSLHVDVAGGSVFDRYVCCERSRCDDSERLERDREQCGEARIQQQWVVVASQLSTAASSQRESGNRPHRLSLAMLLQASELVRRLSGRELVFLSLPLPLTSLLGSMDGVTG